MKHLYAYTLTLPLTYCTYDLRSEDSEFVLGLESPVEWDEMQNIEKPYPLKDNRIFTASEKIHFCLSSKFTKNVSDDGNHSYDMPDKFFNCTVSGIVAESQTEAREIVDAFVVKACKALSILMSCKNCNKQGYQPRVEPDYKQQKWEKEEYPPYEELVEEVCASRETIDEKGNRIIHMYVDHTDIETIDKVYTTIFGKVDVTNFFEFYHYEKSPDLCFILDEYYAALGQEALTSKFFHLFSIIEYVEKNYVHLADTKTIFEDDDRKLVKKSLEELEMPTAKRKRLVDSVMNAMSKATEIGREEKLVNILHNMGINEFTNCVTPFVIDKKTVKELTALRNSYYHGDGKKKEKGNCPIRVELAVTKLMYICEKIIVYVLN